MPIIYPHKNSYLFPLITIFQSDLMTPSLKLGHKHLTILSSITCEILRSAWKRYIHALQRLELLTEGKGKVSLVRAKIAHRRCRAVPPTLAPYVCELNIKW
jgi:hypothetical protein